MFTYISSLPDERRTDERPRRIAILGSTGSIGCSALSVIRLQKDEFQICGLAGGRNLSRLAEQAVEFRPPLLVVLNEGDIAELRSALPSGYTPEILYGQAGYAALARLPEATYVLSAQVGAAGLAATLAAAEAGKIIALANKESLVLAGNIIRAICARSGACILPVDSEHNAIFQSLAASLTLAHGTPPTDPDVCRVILTASGGPFYGRSRAELAAVTPEQALAHPNWDMGAKVTIDSSTLMNKGLEVIEACHLFGLPLAQVHVMVHSGSIVHSLVEYADGSQLAQLGMPDMRVPIAHCLGWPRRLRTGVAKLDLTSMPPLSFARPDEENFPCLGLARRAQEHGRGSPVVLNAANEIAVAAFLECRIAYPSIARTVRHCLETYESGRLPGYAQCREPADIDAILALDEAVRTEARAIAYTTNPADNHS